MYSRRFRKRKFFAVILCWLPLLLLYVQFSKNIKIKTIFEQNQIPEQEPVYNFDDLQSAAFENITYAASYDVTPKRKSLLPGENGAGVVIPFYRMKEENEGYKLHGFNSLASDIIPLERRLKDYRKPE